MATFRQRGNRWQVQVRQQGVNQSRTFATHREARAWAAEVEGGKRREGTSHTLREALERYAQEVSITKKGERWECLRLAMLTCDPVAELRFRDLKARDIAEWRDRRLQKVSGASVNRELNVLSSVFERARKEWGWATENPTKDVQRPPRPRPRVRRITEEEIERVLLSLHYDEAEPVTLKIQELAVAFLLAIETGMRMGELVGLRWAYISLDEAYLTLIDSKNSDSRQVPLSRRARELLAKLRHQDPPFRFTGQSGSALFYKAVRRAGIEDLTFHDTRHEALTRLARRLGVLELARMVGHRDPRSLMIYFNPTASELARKLD